MSRVLVIGAGVVGLTCAIRLCESGHEVHVLARDLPQETTSAVAAALWYPYQAFPAKQVARWGARSYEQYAALADAEPDAGIRIRWGTQLLTKPSSEPAWAERIPTFTHIPHPPSGFSGGWRFSTPVIDMSRYLEWLCQRLGQLGGTITRMALEALPAQAEAVVNCAGLGARLLANDPSVHPSRGQVVHVDGVDVDEWLLIESEDGRPCYVVPRVDDVVIGGTDDPDDWDRTARTQIESAMVRRASERLPQLAEARILRRRVGLRPLRPQIRLDTDRHHDQTPIVHCYGHGGAGVTLSWGCADDVCAMVTAAVTS